MDARRRRALGRRALRAARFRRNRRGVVSVVGTLLSLLVFFALFGVFLTQYLPLWMAQNESQYSNQAQASIETLKQYVDDQMIFGGPHTYSVPFVMSSNGIPLFAQPTQGTLSFLNGCAGNFQSNGTPTNPAACTYQRLVFSVLAPQSKYITACAAPNNIPYLTNQTVNFTSATNYVEMQLPNRYYPGQTFFYEGDAAIQSQSGGSQLMLVSPPFNLTNTSGNATLTSSFVILEGNSSSFASQGSKNVYSTLLSSSTFSSFSRFSLTCSNGPPPTSPTAYTFAVPFDAIYTVGTHNPCAWYNFLRNSTLQAGVKLVTNPPAFVATPSGFSTTPGAILNLTGPGLLSAKASTNHPSASMCSNPAGPTYDVTLTVFNLNYLQGYSGVAQISLSNGGL